MSQRDVANLEQLLNAALRSEQLDRALDLFAELETLEPGEPRWAHQRGDLLARVERVDEAVTSFERAADLYAARGLLMRAVAMAKVILGFDASRTDVIARIDPEAARELHRRHRSLAQRAGMTPKLSPAPYPALSPAADAADDEVRFDDAPAISLDVTPLEIGGRMSFPELTVEGMSEGAIELANEPEAERRAPTPDQLAMLPAFAVFAELPPEAFPVLASRSELVELEDGEVAVTTGEPADSLYAIVEGRARVDVPGLDGQPVFLGEGDVFGESCLVEGATRRADVTAVGKLVTLRITESDVEALVEAHPGVGDVMFDLLTRRVVGNLMATSPIFAGFDPTTRSEIAKLFEARKSEEGQAIIERGKRGDGLYILLAGTLELGTDDTSELLEPITMVGQGALLSHPSTYSVHSLSEALLLRLPASRFFQLAALYPTVLETLSELASLPAAVQLM